MSAWPPTSIEEARSLRDVRIRELQDAQRKCSRHTKSKKRDLYIVELHNANERLRRVNEWIEAENKRAKVVLTLVTVAEPDGGELEEIPMSNSDFLHYVAHMRAKGKEGPFPRPMIRRAVKP